MSGATKIDLHLQAEHSSPKPAVLSVLTSKRTVSAQSSVFVFSYGERERTEGKGRKKATNFRA